MLTVRSIDSAKPKDKPYKLADSGSLYLYISPSGSKSWRLDYQFNDKRKTLTIGKYPYLSLAEAREAREQAKKLIAHGKDPSLIKKYSASLLSKELENTFKKIAIEWHNNKIKSWSKGYADEVMSIFEKDIFPYLGNEPVNKIKPLELLTVLKLIEDRGAIEIAKKARMRCSEVFRYAVITGRTEVNPASELASAMVNRTSKNFPFLTESEMREFMKALNGYAGNIISRMATKLLILTALRTVEMRTIEWGLIDFDNRLITIREEIVKKDRVHVVPISDQVFDILDFLKPITGHGKYVFSGRNDPNKPISEGTVLGVIKRIGFVNRASGHGFRHQFSTVLNEHGFNDDWIEKQLNHEKGNVRGIYNHAQYLEGRREMMQWYADYIDKLSA